MGKTASVITRIDPAIKEQAESVLEQLGISMSTAMEIYLRQIAMQRKIPFEMALPNNKPIAFGSLTDDEFNSLMGKTLLEYKKGETLTADQVQTDMHRKYGI